MQKHCFQIKIFVQNKVQDKLQLSCTPTILKKMMNFIHLKEKFQHFFGCLCVGLVFLLKSLYWACTTICDFFAYRLTHFWTEVCYFIFLSCVGFLVLRDFKPRSYPVEPRAIDMFFTSVSAATVSSMSTVEMEVFSNAQLVILTILMFIGGEVFTSMVGLHFMSSKLKYTPQQKARSRINSVANLPLPSEGFDFDEIELGTIRTTQGNTNNLALEKTKSEIDFLLKSKSVKVLGFVVLGYLLVVHVLGISMVFIYVNVISSAKKVLENKGLKAFTFSTFTIVSTFASCGFIPTNENMVVFRQNSGLLLMLIPQILLGNTLFPSFLRLSIWVLNKFAKKDETDYLLRNTTEIQYLHWLPSKHSKLLVATVLSFIVVQFVLFTSLDWDLQGLSDLNVHQRIVGMLFQCVNSRHTGESIVDITTISSAVLVIFIVMMYLPPYTSFLPRKYQGEDEDSQFLLNKGENKKGKKTINFENLIFSQLSYLVVFIMIICVTERKKMKEDPLNFNVLNVVVEVISAYGNVGFSTGYSCAKQLKPDPTCVDKWYGFAGKWSDEGKIALIVVMFFGRLKKFNMRGGKAWELL